MQPITSARKALCVVALTGHAVTRKVRGSCFLDDAERKQLVGYFARAWGEHHRRFFGLIDDRGTTRPVTGLWTGPARPSLRICLFQWRAAASARRYCTASATCATCVVAAPARSAIVRATFNTR